MKNSGWVAHTAGLVAASLVTAACSNPYTGHEEETGRASEFLREHGYQNAQIGFVRSLTFDENVVFCGASTDAPREQDDAKHVGGRVYAFHTNQGSGILCVRNGGTVELVASPVAVPAVAAEGVKP